PKQMGAIGTDMHGAASRLARIAEEGDRLETYDQLNEVTATCVACHVGYRIG
ncbi:MAG: cytochrome c, partial [Gammaproteobacteria bacterium]|nr:cytochrome c [Gammaproteobacteria bacterium]